jgi:acylphosphatase
MIKKASIRVTGLVQGVNYRYNTQRKGDEFGLAGTVRNMPDGSVQIVCEGEESAILSLIEWCKRGPRGAFVERVDVAWGERSGSFSGFSIAY